MSAGRFAEPQADAFRRLNASISFDWRLSPYDVDQSVAHAAMLAAQGIISEQDGAELQRGLEIVRAELVDGTFTFHDGDEDIHMAIERRLTEIVGPVGGRLHTARSRNDQVATDVAMFVRAHAHEALERIGRLAATLIDQAERHLDWPLPGYTHLQRAQPIYLSHHLLAYVWMLIRDRSRFQAVVEACGRLPLGAGALAGVNLDTDRGAVAALGFLRGGRELGRRLPPPATSCSITWPPPPPAPPIWSRLGAEIAWSSEESFGFCEVSDAWASGSSIMPQKKNPDAAELLRAKAPRLAANLSALYGVMHGLPLTYNKDMQEDKERLFDSCDTLELCLEAAEGMLESISFRRERLARAASDQFLAATDIADLLVRRGMPFREAHGVVAGLVRVALEQGKTLSELSREQLRAQSELLDDEFYALLRDGAGLETKVSEGGTSLRRVREQLQDARAALR